MHYQGICTLRLQAGMALCAPGAASAAQRDAAGSRRGRVLARRVLLPHAVREKEGLL